MKFDVFLFLIYLILSNLDGYSQPNVKKTNANTVANKFEGSISFYQKTLNDTFLYTYYIKDRNIRVDIHENCKNCTEAENYLLFDLDKKTILAVSPSRKLFINLPLKPFRKQEEKDFTIVKSNNQKVINGYTCYQWRVKNVSQNTEITYWVTNDNFSFFEEFLQLWNRSEKHAIFFLHINESFGFFPMESVERTLLRDEKMKLSVVNIKKEKIGNNFFEIPKDYKSYDQ